MKKNTRNKKKGKGKIVRRNKTRTYLDAAYGEQRGLHVFSLSN
jgi:hypothetical protein